MDNDTTLLGIAEFTKEEREQFLSNNRKIEEKKVICDDLYENFQKADSDFMMDKIELELKPHTKKLNELVDENAKIIRKAYNRYIFENKDDLLLRYPLLSIDKHE